MQDIHWGVLTPLQRCSSCCLEFQLTGLENILEAATQKYIQKLTINTIPKLVDIE